MNSIIDKTILISCFSLFGFFPLGAMENTSQNLNFDCHRATPSITLKLDTIENRTSYESKNGAAPNNLAIDQTVTVIDDETHTIEDREVKENNCTAQIANKVQHIKEDAKDTTICKWCGEELTSSYYLISHIRGKHCEKYDLTIEEAKPHKCDECMLRFTDKWILNNHRLKKHHHPKNKYAPQSERTCEECGKVLSTKKMLNEHRLIHLQCRNCSKIQPTKLALKEHTQTCFADTTRNVKRKDNSVKDKEIAKKAKSNQGAE